MPTDMQAIRQICPQQRFDIALQLFSQLKTPSWKATAVWALCDCKKHMVEDQWLEATWKPFIDGKLLYEGTEPPIAGLEGLALFSRKESAARVIFDKCKARLSRFGTPKSISLQLCKAGRGLKQNREKARSLQTGKSVCITFCGALY